LKYTKNKNLILRKIDFKKFYGLEFYILICSNFKNILGKTKKTMAKGKKNKKDINNPHDKFFRVTFSMKIIVQDYFKNMFPQKWTNKLDLDSLKLESVSYITNDLKNFFSDIVWLCQLKGSDEYVQVAFLFEHKSYVPDYPNLQILDYKRGGYNTQLSEGQTLKLIIPIIVFHGAKKWEVKPFSSYFGNIPPEFQGFIDPLEYYLTNLDDYSDEMIKAFKAIFLVKTLLALKHFSEGKYIKQHYAELLLVGYENDDSKNEVDFIQYYSVYLSQISDAISEAEIIEQIEEFEDNLKPKNMDYVAVLLERAKKQGRQEGRQEGEKFAIYKAFKRNDNIDLLSEIFGLSPEILRDIIDEMKTWEIDNMKQEEDEDDENEN
jgi:predicted transposase/invertase (TIGR01784 family)